MTTETLIAAFAILSRVAPDVAPALYQLAKAVGSGDMSAAQAWSVEVVKSVMRQFGDGGRGFLRHVIRELSEHDVANAIANELMGTSKVDE